jgi:hypothetical protein
MNTSPTLVFISCFVIFFLLFLLLRQKSEDDNRYYDLKSELNDKVQKLNAIIEEKQTVQVSADGNLTKTQKMENRNIIMMPSQPTPTLTPTLAIDPVNGRDHAVINDALYPPLARTDRPTIDLAMANPAITGYPTRGSPDTFRPLALAKDKTSGETYYLMGREKYRGSSQGEFYMIPTDKQNRLKIQLLDDRGNQLIRDIYSIPDEIKIKTGIFKDKEYQVEELKKTEYIGPYI